jgi:hypothetical protein
MFKINPAPTVLVAVSFGLAAGLALADGSTPAAVVPVAGDDASTLQLTCKFMPREQRQALLQRFAQVGTDGVTNGVLFSEFVLSWNVVEDDGTPVVLSVAAIDRLLGNFEQLGELVLAQWMTACAEVRAKN